MKKLLLAAGALAFSVPGAAEEPLFDMHVHLHRGEESLRAYEAQNQELDGEPRAFGAMWFGGPNQARAGNPAAIRAHNDALMALATRSKGMLPIATVHPYDGSEALKELERVAALGYKVLKLHPHTQGFETTDPRVAALVKRAGELKIVVLFDNAGIVPNDSVNLFNLALAHPKTTFVFAHMGGMGFRFWSILGLARTAEGLFGNNIYFDISGPVTIGADSPLADELVWTMRNVGIDQLLFGSDFPQLPVSRTLEALEKLDLTDEEKAKIRYGNAKRLFDLP